MRQIILPMFLLAAAAPMAEARQTVTAAPRGRIVMTDRNNNNNNDGDRAMLGVSTSASGKRDTLGLLIESVTPGSPAEKAGLEEGNRIASINGVSLKLAREDAGESDMSGAMTNRLVREMRKLKAGDEVTLEVWSGRYKSVKVKTVAADDLSENRMTRQNAEERAVLGVSLGSNGSKRDTAGVFVSSVTDGGPADKAGINEGDRIASVNGIDLRVSKEDVGDASVASARVSRLQREIAKLKPGQTVDLSVVEGGRARTVKVTLGRAKDLDRGNGFSYTIGDGPGYFSMPRVPMPPMPPMSPMEPMTPMAPMAPMAPMPPRARYRVYDGNGDFATTLDALRDRVRDIGPEVRAELELSMPRLKMQLDRELPAEMDKVRTELNRMRLQIPMITTRIGRRVII
jgi:serine protease Do